jgi:hypothetical protein
MEVLGIRYCSVTAEAAALIKVFAALGMSKTDYAEEGISGSVFPAGSSWIEVCQGASDSPANTMLHGCR